MRKIGNWVVIENRDTISMTLNISTLIKKRKHFEEERYRSYLCTGPTCSYCLRHVPRRIRHQAEVIIEGEKLWWEFSEGVYKAIKQLIPIDGCLEIKVTRLGAGNDCEYKVRQENEPCQDNAKFTKGKYGHMVRT